MARPFKCDKCGNWYVEVPRLHPVTKEPVVCRDCQDRRHAANRVTGVIDCHFHHESATYSERKLTEILLACTTAESVARDALKAISKETMPEHIDKAVLVAGNAYAAALTAEAEAAEALRWAGVMEMPGMTALDNEHRFKSFEVIETFVKRGRRPPEDVATLRRSMQNCADLMREIATALPRAKAAYEAAVTAQERRLAPPPVAATAVNVPASFTKPERTEEQKQKARERTARARAAAKAKREAEAVPA